MSIVRGLEVKAIAREGSGTQSIPMSSFCLVELAGQSTDTAKRRLFRPGAMHESKSVRWV